MGDCTAAGRDACLSIARSNVAIADSVSRSRIPAIVMYAEKTFEMVMASLEASKDVTACSMLLSIACSVLVDRIVKGRDRKGTDDIWSQSGIESEYVENHHSQILKPRLLRNRERFSLLRALRALSGWTFTSTANLCQ